jgi:6-phosphogluconolactonase
VDMTSGRLALKENIPSGGRTPRNIRFDPSGNWFFSANETGGNITEFRVDKSSGHLTQTGVSVPIDTPGGLYLLKSR